MTAQMTRAALIALLAMTSTAAACSHQEPAAVSYPTPAQSQAGEMQRDPLQRLTLMDQLHRQIVYKTRSIPEPRYQQVVRPRLALQLQATGLDAADAERVLRDVDYTRGLHNRG